MSCGVMIFKKISNFIFFLIFFYYIYFFHVNFCFIDLNRQSEYSGLRPDTSSLVFIYYPVILAELPNTVACFPDDVLYKTLKEGNYANCAGLFTDHNKGLRFSK